MRKHVRLLHALLSSGLLLMLTVGNALPAAAGQKPDPSTGPHARDEARQASSIPHFNPAKTRILPRKTGAPSGGPALALLGTATDGVFQVVPAPRMTDGPVIVEPAALGSPGGLQREVFGFAPYWQLANSGNWNYNLLSTIAYFGLDVNGDGSFSTSTGGWNGWNSQELVNMINLAHQAGDRVVVVIKAFDNATINSIVTSPSASQTAITNTINAIASKSLDGVNVDFEGSSSPSFPNIQTGFTNFMTQLSRQVHQRWPDAMVSADTYSGSAGWDGGIFNIGALAPAVDAFFVMAYDMVFSNLSGQAGPNAPLNGWTYNDNIVVAQYLAKAPASKVILGVPYYGYKWSTTSNQPYAATRSGGSADTYAGILDDFACARVTRSWDTTGESPWAFWFSPASGDPCGANFTSWRELYYDDATSLGLKYDLVNAKGLRGAGLWALGYDGTSQDLWQVLGAKFSWTATYDTTKVPRNWAANQTQTFPVTATNTGLQTWPAGGPNPVHLGLHFATSGGGWPAHSAWVTDQRFSLPADVGSGASVTLTVTVTAPPTTSAMVLEAEMVKESQFWFKQWDSVSVIVAPPVWAAGYDASAVPRLWATNQAQTFPVTLTNTGNQTWPAGGPNPVRLGLHFASAAGGWPNNGAWLTDQRFSLPADVGPGTGVTLTITVTAPPTNSAVVLEAEMVKEFQFWFQQWVPISVGTAPALWAAGHDVGSVPRSWTPSQTQTFPVTITNIGNQVWPAGGPNPVHLGMHFATAAGLSFSSWLSDQRVSLPADVPPGASVTLTVSATAPPGADAVVLEARMVKEWQFWFGQWGPVAVADVPPTWTAGLDATAAPRLWATNQAQTFPVKLTNTGNQTWPAAGANPVHLGLHFASAAGGWLNNAAWLTDQRVSLPADVVPGGSVTLTVTVTAPATSNAVVLEAEMVKEFQFWFQQWAPISVGTAPVLWAAGYDVSSVPRSWARNQTQTFNVTVTNAGNQTWLAGGPNPVHLGMHYATAAGLSFSNWLTDQRISLPADLPPGASVTLAVSAAAPASPGALILEARMVKESQFWFDEWSPVAVTNVAP